MFGLTHDTDGNAIIREARILKVGIGLPKGKAINVWIHNDNKWRVRIGYKPDDSKTMSFESAKQAEEFYRANLAKAPTCPYPRKIGFFTFTRPVIDDGGEIFEPDWQAIEAHGPMPTEIDIVFLDDQPFSGAYQMWSTAELKCRGDGINARRVLAMAATDEEKALAQEAKQNGEKYFPIIEKCWTCGCPYSRESAEGKPSPCKPGGDLRLQLARNIRVGGTAYFHTSGYRSIGNIFSSLERIKTLTGGRLSGIPLKMVLRPYKTKHDGQAATQYGVSLEFRAEDVEALRKNLIEQAWKFRSVAEAPVRRLIESVEPALEEDDEEVPISAQAMTDEFYPEETAPPPKKPAAAVKTDEKTAKLAENLKQRRTATEIKKAQPAEQENVQPQLREELAAALAETEPAPTASVAQEGDLF